MNIETIRWNNGRVELIDQTLLPQRCVMIRCTHIKTLWKAIKELKVRGAPAIGIAGALGIVLGMQRESSSDVRTFMKRLGKVKRYLASSRPTAVNLFWALDRMERAACEHIHESVPKIKRRLIEESLAIIKEDKIICRSMATHGARLVSSGDRLLTHCNAGGLATADYGTALGVFFKARAQRKKIRVYVYAIIWRPV